MDLTAELTDCWVASFLPQPFLWFVSFKPVSQMPVCCSSRMRRKRIQVRSGPYCNAPAQFERPMMSQMDLTAELTDCWVASFLPQPFLWFVSFKPVSQM